MKIGENEKTFVALSYELTVDGEVVEKVTAESPLQFIYGAGFLLPKFEAHLKGLSKGDDFAFHLDTEDAYGPVISEAVVDLPKEVFMVDGKIEDGLLEIGNQLPMSDIRATVWLVWLRLLKMMSLPWTLIIRWLANRCISKEKWLRCVRQLRQIWLQ